MADQDFISRPLARLLLYDKHAGGLGVCDELYSKGLPLLQKALQLLSSCLCDAGASAGDERATDTMGCPACLLDQRYRMSHMYTALLLFVSNRPCFERIDLGFHFIY